MNLGNVRAYPRFKAAGVKTDCEKLLRAFQQKQSVRFVDFAKLWRERKFSFIFGGRISEKELMEFTEESLLIALSFAMPPHPFQWRTGGLYLLYSFYFKQPQSYKVPIRVTIENWKELQKYIKEVKEQNHLDIHYAFRSLEMSNAFQFVAFHTEHSPTVPSSGASGSLNPLSVNTSSVLQFVEDGFLQHLEALHEKYSSMKCQLVCDDSVSSIRKELTLRISDSIKAFEDKRTKSNVNFTIGQPKEDDDDDDDDKNDSKAEASIGSHRRALKQKSLQLKATTRRSRRNRAVVVAKNSPSPSKSPKRKLSRRQRRVSGRSVTSDSGAVDQDAEGEGCNIVVLSMPILANVKQEDSSSRDSSNVQD